MISGAIEDGPRGDPRVLPGAFRSRWHRLPRRWSSVAELGAVFALCVALLLHHPTHRVLWHTLYAEDGRKFLQCRLNHGLSCLDHTYQGYWQLAPRLLLEPVPWLPVGRWALAVTLLVVAVDALCLVIVYRTIGWLMPPRSTRAVAVAAVAASAAAHIEVAGNTANLHWWLLVSALFLAADRNSDDRLLPTALRTLWLVLVCLSEALTPVIAVSYLVGTILRRARRGRWSRRDLSAGVVVLAAAVSEFIVALVEPRLKQPAPAQTVADALHGYWTAVVRDGWNGPVTGGRVLARVVLVVVVLMVLAGIVLAGRRRALPSMWRLRLSAVALLLIGSVADLIVSVTVNDLLLERYTFVPFALLVVALFVLVSALYEGSPWSAAVPVLGGVALVVGMLVVGPYPPYASTRGPSWHAQVGNARRECRSAPDRGSATLLTAPNARWFVVVRCSRLRS